MPDYDDLTAEVDRFILEQVDSVPHLEALLLLKNSHPRGWRPEALARELFIETPAAARILDELTRRQLAAPAPAQPECFCFEASAEMKLLVAAVDETYRRELVRISRMIHSKPATAVRDFARAFRLGKGRE